MFAGSAGVALAGVVPVQDRAVGSVLGPVGLVLVRLLLLVQVLLDLFADPLIGQMFQLCLRGSTVAQVVLENRVTYLVHRPVKQDVAAG